MSRPEIRLLIGAMRDLGDVVGLVGGRAVCRNPEDDAVIETAIRGNADVLISGDKDLTDAPEVSQALATAGIHVLTVARFVTELEGSIG